MRTLLVKPFPALCHHPLTVRQVAKPVVQRFALEGLVEAFQLAFGLRRWARLWLTSMPSRIIQTSRADRPPVMFEPQGAPLSAVRMSIQQRQRMAARRVPIGEQDAVLEIHLPQRFGLAALAARGAVAICRPSSDLCRNADTAPSRCSAAVWPTAQTRVESTWWRTLATESLASPTEGFRKPKCATHVSRHPLPMSPAEQISGRIVDLWVVCRRHR